MVQSGTGGWIKASGRALPGDMERMGFYTR